MADIELILTPDPSLEVPSRSTSCLAPRTDVSRSSTPADDDGAIKLQAEVDADQHRYASHELFPNGRLTNYLRYTKADMEARCIVERLPGSRPHCVTRWRPALRCSECEAPRLRGSVA